MDGRAWLAVEGGRSLTGRHSDSGAPLLHVTFHAVEQPDVPLRELVAVGRSLDRYADEDLAELLERSRPFEQPPASSPPPKRSERRGR